MSSRDPVDIPKQSHDIEGDQKGPCGNASLAVLPRDKTSDREKQDVENSIDNSQIDDVRRNGR